MDTSQELTFSALVSGRLTHDDKAYQLWVPMSQEFDRTGAEAAKEYLDRERQLLQDRIDALLTQLHKD